MPNIKNISSSTVYSVTATPKWVAGVWECGNLRFVDPDGTQFMDPAAGGTMNISQFWLLFTVDEETQIRAAAAGGMLPAGASFTTASGTITMMAANPGWVIPNMVITDHTASDAYVGIVSSWTSGDAVTLTANAAVGSSGTSDMLNFAGDQTIATWLRRLDDPRTLTVDLSLDSISGTLTYLTSAGLLASGRTAQLLAGTPQ